MIGSIWTNVRKTILRGNRWRTFHMLLSNGLSNWGWCYTEEDNNLRVEFRDQNNIFRVVAYHQNHVVAFATISERLWVMFLDFRECGGCVEDLVRGGGLGQRCWTTSEVLWACNRNNNGIFVYGEKNFSTFTMKCLFQIIIKNISKIKRNIYVQKFSCQLLLMTWQVKEIF